MARNFSDWLKAYMKFASHSEAPAHLHFWTGVSAIAGAIKRKAWIDQAYFRWHCNFYIVLVAPPGIISKSTTASIGMQLLHKVPGVKFGPDVVTWPALVQCFGEATETFELNGEFYPMSALTLESSEFGNLVNPQDKEMIDLLVSLYDGKQGAFEKKTKGSGCDTVENPWVNLIACTTPSWIAGNFPEYMIGGGFTSRCLFIYADEKAKYVAYPFLHVPDDLDQTKGLLVEDLIHISENIVGNYVLSKGAIEFGEIWYEHHYKNRPVELDDDRFGGYIARKQTHVHKLAMILAASCSDKMEISEQHLKLAVKMVSDLEPDMVKVFQRIGKSDISVAVDRLVNYVHKRGGVPYGEVYRYMHSAFPSMRDFEDILQGCVRAGYVIMRKVGESISILPGLSLDPPKERIAEAGVVVRLVDSK